MVFKEKRNKLLLAFERIFLGKGNPELRERLETMHQNEETIRGYLDDVAQPFVQAVEDSGGTSEPDVAGPALEDAELVAEMVMGARMNAHMSYEIAASLLFDPSRDGQNFASGREGFLLMVQKARDVCDQEGIG